jgi:hypothetical protein
MSLFSAPRLRIVTMTRMGWYVRRLGAMAPAEVATHGRRSALHRVDDLRWRFVRGTWRSAWEPAAERLLVSEPQLGRPLGPLSAEDAAAACSACGAGVDALLELARRRLDGYAQLLGYPELRVPEDTAVDPVSGVRWPDTHGRLIDFRHGAPGDPKLVWEINRLQELPLLCAAWLAAGDERFAAGALHRLTRWLERNPPGRGVAWANAYEPGLRAISIAVAFDALRAYSSLTAEAARRILLGLWQHARWIERDRSEDSSANNHLIGELVGILAVSLLAPELRDAARWRKLALDGLAREAELQVLPDGSCPEQSFHYGLFVSDLLLVAVALLDARGQDVPQALTRALSRTGDMLALLLAADEPDPVFGDADDGRTLLVDGVSGRDARVVAASIASRLGHSGARRVAGEIDVQAAFLFGVAGVERFDATEPAPQPGSGALPDGGLVVLRDGGSRALFDVGPLGYLSIAAHGHADALQLVLSYGPDELVSDPGTGSYLDPEVRSALRGTAAHATVTADGEDQSEQGGAFLWTRHARSRLLRCDAENGVAIAEHDGYERLPGRVRHRRAVVTVGGGAILVIDRLRADVEHEYEQVWPLAPGLVPERVSPELVTFRGGAGAELSIAFAATVPFQVAADETVRWSRHLEQVESARRCAASVRTAGAVGLAALLVPCFVASTALEIAAEGPLLHVRWELDGRRSVRVDLDSAAPSVELDWRSG